jgi:hypothetical protein
MYVKKQRGSSGGKIVIRSLFTIGIKRPWIQVQHKPQIKPSEPTQPRFVKARSHRAEDGSLMFVET